MFPPGRARLATNPVQQDPILRHDNGNRNGCFLGSHGLLPTSRNDDVYFETHQFGGKRGEAVQFSLCISPLNDNVFPLHVSKLAQTLPECLDAGRRERKGSSIRNPMRGTFVGCCASAMTRNSKQYHCNQD